MPSHSKPDLSVSALLHNLTEELDRKKMQKVDDLLLSKAQSSVRYRLGPRVSQPQVQLSYRPVGGELCGVIFMCNRRTWKECLGQCLFGLPIGKKILVEQVVPGMKLFLFEYERRQLWGVFEAISYGGMDIIPDAYSGGSFPCQVRVNVPEDCVALYEEEFCNAIKDNYFSADKFHFDLTGKQVYHLISLFERKYMRAKGMEPGFLEYEDKQCTPMGPLLLTNDESYIYPEDLNITALPHNMYSHGFQIMQDSSFFNSKEGMGFVYRNIENFTSHRTCETRPLIPLSNAIVQGNCLPLNVDVTSFTNIGGQLGDFDTGDMIPVYSTSTKQETIETVVFPGHASRLHSDKPMGKSVWTRISGRAKPLTASETAQKQGKLPASLAQSLPPNVLTESEVAGVVLSSIQEADVNEEVAEEVSVGFKRRRVSSNSDAAANANKTPTNKRRRKLTRPFFDASADEPCSEQMVSVAESVPLLCASNADVLHNGTRKAPLEEQHTLKIESCDLTMLTAPVSNEEIIRNGRNNENDAMQAENSDYQSTKLDLNIPLESQVEDFVKSERHNKHSDNTSLGEERGQESSALALSLPTQETDYLLHRAGKEIELIGNIQNRTEGLALVEDDKHDSMSHLDDGLINSMTLFKEVDKADGEDSRLGNSNFGQGFELLPHISSECTSLESMATDSSRANTLNLAPCTPAKEVVGSCYPAINLSDEGQGLALLFHDSAQEIPLKLELGNGAKLPDVKVQSDNNASSEHTPDNSLKAENGNEATILGTSNGISKSGTISLDCTSGSSLLSSVDLKSILSGLQVSGIKLQLGSSPCLILQLGDSSLSVDNQDQEGTSQTCAEASVKGPFSDEDLMQRPSSS